MPIMNMHADHAECTYIPPANSLVWGSLRLTPRRNSGLVVTLKHAVIMNDIASPACIKVQDGEVDDDVPVWKEVPTEQAHAV